AGHEFGAAGVAIGSQQAGRIDNMGRIEAGSDRAIVDVARYDAAGIGNLMLTNQGTVTGFVDLAPGGQNTFVNQSGGAFELRHFADTDGDGVRDTKRVATSNFGSGDSRFDNMG